MIEEIELSHQLVVLALGKRAAPEKSPAPDDGMITQVEFRLCLLDPVMIVCLWTKVSSISSNDL